MAAPLGFKTFNSGDVLTAADTNGYLMQGVWTFANAAARTAAVTSPQEGNVSFLKDTNSFEIYDGAAWVAYGSGDITEVQAGTGISVASGTGPIPVVTNTVATAFDAKGDLIGGTGADTFTRLAVGTNGQALLADSTTATGLKWGSASSTASYSLLGTGTTTSGSTVTVSGISGVNNLLILLRNISTSSAGSDITFRINGDSTAKYDRSAAQVYLEPTYSPNSQIATSNQVGSTAMYINNIATGAAASVMAGVITVAGCNSSGIKVITANSGCGTASGWTSVQANMQGGVYTGTSTVSSVSLITSAGTFDAGSYEVYGSI